MQAAAKDIYGQYIRFRFVAKYTQAFISLETDHTHLNVALCIQYMISHSRGLFSCAPSRFNAAVSAFLFPLDGVARFIKTTFQILLKEQTCPQPTMLYCICDTFSKLQQACKQRLIYMWFISIQMWNNPQRKAWCGSVKTSQAASKNLSFCLLLIKKFCSWSPQICL